MGKKEVKIEDYAFEYAGRRYDCNMAILRDKEQIIQEAKSSHEDILNDYDIFSLEANTIRLFLDNNNNPMFGIIIYSIWNIKDKYRRTACGDYYPINSDLLMLLPHTYQASICW